MSDVDLTDELLRVLLALRAESPWRFGNGIVDRSVADRFGDPYVSLDYLMRLGLISYEFYATGAVHEFSITDSGRAAVSGATP
jgi:hypothetical protein